MRFSGKERIKDLLGLFLRQPHAGIADRDQQLTILAQLRLNRKYPTCFLVASMALSMRFMNTCCTANRTGRVVAHGDSPAPATFVGLVGTPTLPLPYCEPPFVNP